MGQDVVTTYLELTDPAAVRPGRPPVVPCEVVRVEPPDGAVNRWCYEHVGADWTWIDHLDKDDAWWQAHAETVETWLLLARGERAGYFELHVDGDDVQVAYFGLVRDVHGLGLGGHLLTCALRRGFELGGRVWLHTCSLDGPHALANYLARGLVPYHVAR